MPRPLPRLPRFLLGAVAATLLVVLCSTATSALKASAVEAPTSFVPASAAGQVAWSMMPVITNIGEERSNFAYALEPGAVVEDAVLVRNSGAAVLDLAVYGSDAFTDGSGALDIATAETGSAAIGTWIAPSVASVHIEPGEVARIPFSVSVPADAQPGEHAGALLTVLQSAGETVSVDMRYATRVTVTVAGDLTAGLSLDQAQLDVATGFWPWEAASADVSYVVGNTGNTRLTAIQLVTAPGVELYSSPDASTGLLTLAELLPAARVDVHATVEGLSAWLPFTAIQVAVSPTVIASASDEMPTIAQQQLSLSAVAIAPGWWVLLAGAALVLVVAVRFAVRRRVTPPRTP
ncbi:hypothetical protein [Microbacterium sp. A93]|uniref:hypothetical protein n=1 Tax=Microbacterium sp. A93 TaxID=3450716 RepID=UPI003F441FE3